MPQVASDTIDNTWERCQEKGSKAYGEELMLHVYKMQQRSNVVLMLASAFREATLGPTPGSQPYFFQTLTLPPDTT